MKKILFLLAFASSLSSCSLFKVYAGKVEYSDTQRQLHMSADSVYVENNKPITK